MHGHHHATPVQGLPGEAVREVVEMPEWEAAESRRKRVGPIIVRNPQVAVELDAALGFGMDFGEPEGHPVFVKRDHRLRFSSIQ